VFRVKICGVTSVDQLRLVAASGADAVGLNFYPGSPRCVEDRSAQAMLASWPAGVCRVGLFVNASTADVREAVRRYQLDMVQLHGDEPPEFLAALPDIPLVRAFRCPAGLMTVSRYLQACRTPPAAVLVDAFSPGQFGGTGQVADWQRIRQDTPLLGRVPLVLAGGLTPANVGFAIATVHPAAVDTASGVEARPGRKDPQAVREFVAAARSAFARLPTEA
jgi:phosphoribosylanthranilate isomerase